MRLHTNLNRQAIIMATRHLPVAFHKLEIHGSRSRKRAFEMLLTGSGGRNNTGAYGAGDYNGATWDEWGAVLGALYIFDPTMICGGTAKTPVYADAEHYHFLTNERFRAGDIPADTHPRHRWDLQSDMSWACKKCSARRPGWAQAQTYLENRDDPTWRAA